MKKGHLFWATLFLLLVAFCGLSLAGEFTQEDRERLIRLEATLQTFMKQVDKRFEQIDRRIDRRN